MFGDPVVTISIDHVWLINYSSGPHPAIWWGSYIKGDKTRDDLWGTGQWWMECPGLHGADDPLNQGPNFAVRRDGIDNLVAHWLCYDLFWAFEDDPQVIKHHIAEIDDQLWFYNKYPEHLDTKQHFGRLFFEKTNRWPDWKRWINES